MNISSDFRSKLLADVLIAELSHISATVQIY